MTARNRLQSRSGFTLVELIVSIVVIAVAVTGVLLTVQFTTRHSADPVIRQQAVAIAEAYMEEIMLQRYEDPEQIETRGSEAGESRATFDDVYDYNTLPAGHEPRDQTDSPLGLGNYQVSIRVTNSSLGPSGNQTEAAEINATVRHDSASVSFTLTGYKAKY